MSKDTPYSLLHELHLAPPKFGPRCTSVRVAAASELARRQGDPIALNCPLFAHDLPWHLLSPGIASRLAHELTRAQVVTSLLNLDVVGDRPAQMVMCPYRPERYGVTIEDLSQATLVDVRLTTEVGDGSIYTMAQLRRWDHRADTLPDHTVITGARWPADVASPESLAQKIIQLRLLAPQAAIFVTISPFQLEHDLPHAIAASPDGIILRFDLERTPNAGNLIALHTARCRLMMQAADEFPMALWVSAPTIGALDLVKLLALGATAVGIDHLVFHHWPAAVAETSMSEIHALRGLSANDLFDDDQQPDQPGDDFVTSEIQELLGDALSYVHGLGITHYSQLKPDMLVTTNAPLAQGTGAQSVSWAPPQKA